jgi:FHS family glucose/mannose:H+ symporter-like MFS transporter
MAQSRSILPQKDGGGWQSASSLVLAGGFALTGVGTVMLGVLLPMLSRRWSLSDGAAGLLFFLQFAGSALGAVLTGLRRLRAIRIGYALLVVTAGSMSVSGPHVVFIIFFFYGLGLGMTMTASSLLFSDRHPINRAQILERINFAWSAGAMAAPPLLAPYAHAHLRALFFTLQALFGALLVWTLFREKQDRPQTAQPAIGVEPLMVTGALSMLILLAMGAVGVEASMSSWLTTYVHRLAPGAGLLAPLSVTLFYLGVVVSRLVASTSLLVRLGSLRLLRGLLWACAASVAFLILFRQPLLLEATAIFAGLSIGPLYPLLLSLLLERTARGWVFAFGGLGSALFPWLTGICSVAFGSLRWGLAAPLAAAIAMAAMQEGKSRRKWLQQKPRPPLLEVEPAD